MDRCQQPNMPTSKPVQLRVARAAKVIWYASHPSSNAWMR